MKQREISLENDTFWMPLDNAAKIYPAIRTDELTSVFRLCIVLKERVKARQLLKAIHAIEDRFPYYKVTLKTGFFWFYLEHKNRPIHVMPDLDVPCRTFARHDLMFRVLVRENCISVEFSHILTDASGGFEFLKTLLFTYLKYCGIELPETLSFLRAEEMPDKEEFEDAYNHYFRKTVSPRMNLRSAFHLPFSLDKPSRLHIHILEIPADALLKKAKSYGLSLTEYLISIYLYVLQEIHEAMPQLMRRTHNKILRIEVPVNLRNFYSTRTMRNFSVYVLPEIDLRLGHYTFEEIAETVHHLMQLETNKKLIHKIISRNVGGERNLIVKRIPLFIKSIMLKTFYALGTSRYSGVVTNLGRVELPLEISRLIDKFIFIPPPPSKRLKANCAVVGFENKLTLCFGNITISNSLEQQFKNILNEHGITCNIEKY